MPSKKVSSVRNCSSGEDCAGAESRSTCQNKTHLCGHALHEIVHGSTLLFPGNKLPFQALHTRF